MYTLKAVICHKGASASSGHYYAYIRIRNCWFKFDDELITLVDRSEVFDRHYGGFEDPEEEEDESSSTSSSEKPKDGVSEEALKKKQGEPLPYSAYMLLYARNGVDPEPLAPEDVPEAIAAVNRAKPLNVTLLRDGHEAIMLNAFSNQTVSKLIRDAELSLHTPTPHEFFIITDNERHPSRVITRDSNIGGMRLSRLFQRSKNPTIFAFPATLTPIQRLDNSLVNFTHASTPGAIERLMLPRNGKLLDYLPAMRRAFTIPDVPETCIKFGRPSAVYTPNDFGMQMTSNRLALTDCTESGLFSPELCDGTLLILMPADPEVGLKFGVEPDMLKKFGVLMNSGKYDEVIKLGDGMDKDEFLRYVCQVVTSLDQFKGLYGYLKQREMVPGFLAHGEMVLVRKVIVETDLLETDRFW